MPEGIFCIFNKGKCSFFNNNNYFCHAKTTIHYEIVKNKIIMMKKLLLCLMALVAAVTVQAQAVTLPSDATVEDDWVCSFVMHDTEGEKNVSEKMSVAFSGNDVYFNLPNPVAGNTWIKGTMEEGKATFLKGQYLGNYGGAVYMVGQNEQGICDLVFGYNAETHVFTLDNMQLVLSGSATTIDAWGYYTGMTVVKGTEAQGDAWSIAYTMHYQDDNGKELTDSGTESVEVVIDGNDVAINFPNPLNGAGWIHGTINGNVATFAQGQEMGTYGGSPFYLAGQNENGLCDVVFNYDAEQGVFTLGDMYLLINSSTTATAPWCYFSKATITKGGAAVEKPKEDPVTLPAGLTPQRYTFDARDVIYDTDGSMLRMDYVNRPVQVAFDNTNKAVYVQGLCDFLPEAWVKGTIDDDQVVFAKGQFVGEVYGQSVYLMGKTYGSLSDITFNYTNGEMKQGGYVIFNSTKTTEAPFTVYAGANIVKFVEKAAKPSAPQMRYQNYNTDEGYAALMYNIPLTSEDGKTALAEEKLSYRIYTEKGGAQTVYTFTQDKYKNLPEASMTDIPVTFDDGYDFQSGVVFLNDNLDSNDRIGIQSVYKGGGEENVSEITWYQLSAASINNIKGVEVVSETFTDLQGRRVSQNASGLIIKTQRLSDGTVRSMKVMK